ncbi:hypothetical protein SJ174_23975, partial [Enterobacter hormaechei]|uniref:hypothetical protein n=1 Tax=Enterobacter hormaechei TaxID=158836 RepID=UPI0029DABEF0
QGDLAEQHSLFHEVRDERDRIKVELNHMRRAHAKLTENMDNVLSANGALEEEKVRLEEVLALGNGEKKKLSDRVNSLTV